MILHRSQRGVVSADQSLVVVRTRPSMHIAERASLEAFHAGALDGLILEAFDLVALVEALARDLNDKRGLHIAQPAGASPDRALGERTCCCHAGVEALDRHDTLETLVSRADPRAALGV